jgi:energy-coupling factor transporter ATP-binding protein EcfA2
MTSSLQRIFDVRVSCEIPLPGLVPTDGSSADWKIVLSSGGVREEDASWFHRWTSPDGVELMKVARLDGVYFLAAQDLAAFRIDFSRRRIDVHRGEDCAEATLAHLLADQVLPRVICHQGRVMVHASAVRLPNGSAIAFTGPSGAGKSTLATAFHQAGHEVMADDCLLLDRRGDTIVAISAYPSLRLWPDSLQALAGNAGSGEWKISKMAQYSEKSQFLPCRESLPESHQGAELSALFILAEPDSKPAGVKIRIDPAGGRKTIMAIIEAMFALDVRDRTEVQNSFENVGRIACLVAAFDIHYPREFKFLTEVIDSIEGVI